MFPYLEIMFQNDELAWEISYFLDLEDTEIKRFRKKKIPKKVVTKMEKQKAQMRVEERDRRYEELQNQIMNTVPEEVPEEKAEEEQGQRRHGRGIYRAGRPRKRHAPDRRGRRHVRRRGAAAGRPEDDGDERTRDIRGRQRRPRVRPRRLGEPRF